jgi:hypothetical protein
VVKRPERGAASSPQYLTVARLRMCGSLPQLSHIPCQSGYKSMAFDGFFPNSASYNSFFIWRGRLIFGSLMILMEKTCVKSSELCFDVCEVT